MKHKNVLRGLSTVAMGVLVGAAAAVGGQVSTVKPAHAEVPPFTQCPPVGFDKSCAILIVLGPGGSKTTLVDPSQGPFDGVEDTLVGVQNNSGAPVSSIDLTGASGAAIPIFDLDFDGLCAGYFPGPGSPPCPYGGGLSQNYAGRDSDTAVASEASTAFPAETYANISADKNSGTINFVNPGPIPNLGSAYFSLEGPTSSFAPCTSGTPATVTLSPPTAVDTVSGSHTVTATVKDLCMAAVSGATVTFTITRVPPPSPGPFTCTTDGTGMCSITYPGPILPATDTITGCTPGAAGVPVCGAATKAWILPTPAVQCVGDITEGGHMTANNGDRVSFGGVAHSDQASPPSGEEQYLDQGAVLNVHSIQILAVTCSAEKADIYGSATENGSGTHLFRIEVTDPDSSGASDTYEITLDNYESGSHAVQGDVEIHST